MLKELLIVSRLTNCCVFSDAKIVVAAIELKLKKMKDGSETKKKFLKLLGEDEFGSDYRLEYPFVAAIEVYCRTIGTLEPAAFNNMIFKLIQVKFIVLL